MAMCVASYQTLLALSPEESTLELDNCVQSFQNWAFQFILGENLLLLQLGVHHWHKERRVLRELNLTLVQHKLGVDDLRLLNNLSNHLLLLLLRIKPAKRCCKQQRIVTRNKKH